MMRRQVLSFTLTAWVAACMSVAAAADVNAQTLFATRGLGAPINAADSRAAALGGVTTGLSGVGMSLANPADISGLLRRGGSLTMSPIWNDIDLGGASERVGGSRFPLLRVFYPVNVRLAASLSYGAYLDQTWAVQFSGKEVLGSDTARTNDLVSSVGGISQLRLGFSYAVSPTLAVGIGGGMLTGSLDRSVLRTFADSAFEPFESRLRWSYKAPQMSLGVRFDPMTNTRIGASVALAGKLKANAEDSVAQDREYGSSTKLNIGVSTLVAPSLTLVAGATHDKFPEISAASAVTSSGVTPGATTRTTWQYGGGLEYTGLHSGSTRVYPFRLGARWQQLPYAGAGETAPKEFALSLGSGFNMATESGTPSALIDVSVERAKRTGLVGPVASTGLSEKFWRANFTISLFSR